MLCFADSRMNRQSGLLVDVGDRIVCCIDHNFELTTSGVMTIALCSKSL